jgi:hypothetical protein
MPTKNPRGPVSGGLVLALTGGAISIYDTLLWRATRYLCAAAVEMEAVSALWKRAKAAIVTSTPDGQIGLFAISTNGPIRLGEKAFNRQRSDCGGVYHFRASWN